MTDTVEVAPVEGQAPTTGQTPAPTTGAQALSADTQAAWYGEIKDPELAAWAKNKNFPDSETALKSYYSAEKMLGKDRLSIPDPAKLSEWEGWDKLGAPKEADGYKDAVKIPTMPEGMAIDEQFLQAAFAKGAEARIPAAQMQSMIDLYANQQMQAYQAAQEIQKRSVAERDALFSEWGGQKDAKLEAGIMAAKALGFDGEILSQIEDGAGTAKLLKAFATLGEKMREGGLVGGSSGDVSPEQAKAEISKMKADPTIQAILMDQSHPQFEAMTERFKMLSMRSAGL